MPQIIEENNEIKPLPALSQEEISDYEDENFEPDETDEYWGIERNNAHKLKTNRNNLKIIDLQNGDDG